MPGFDLHSHSNVSDGLLDPDALVRLAAQNGAEVFAVTDHDTLDGLEASHRAARDVGIELVSGVEISVTWSGQTVHVVGLAIDPGDADLGRGLARIRAGRMARAERMAAGLEREGVHGTLEGAMKFAANPTMIGRTHFARFLVEQGQVKDIKTVFKRYLVKGKPGFVEHGWADLSDAVGWIRASGGVAVLAHPGRYGFGPNAMKRLLGEFKLCGGMGVEVVTSNHTAEQVQRFTRLAIEFGLCGSRGSDYHGDEGGRVKPGLTAELPPGVTPVWTLCRGHGAAALAC
jgi:3',5'-nucleoside bisphosphate phosphatase